ncbi:MAG: DUF2752 domain-containing protein [Phycisphaeraceae bacterium]|nr:DUF2752 domain-containing protein [Phycisphaeraceae bacterium]
MRTAPATPPAPSPVAPPRTVVRTASFGNRLLAAGVAVACLALLAVASTLSPASNGHGTHMQLGLAPCGWAVATGYPCPTCGMTTSFAAAVRAHPWDAIRAQPMGFLLALVTAVVFWGALHTAVFGSQLPRLGARLLAPRYLWLVAGIWAASWAYKIITWHT